MKNNFAFIARLIVISIGISDVGITSVYAQEVHSSTSLFTSSGLEVSVDGSFTNQGFIQHQGQLSLTGNWMNQSVYQGVGSIALTGNNQLLLNNGQSIHYLIIDGGGTKTIKGKLIVEAQIDFENGIVLVEDLDTLLFRDLIEINSASARSYVEGALTSSGSGYHFFPIGKNGAYHPVILEDIKGLSPIIEMEVFQNLPVIRTATPAEVFHDIYWKRTTVSGSFESSPVTVTYDVPNTISEEELIIASGDDFSEVFLVNGNLRARQVGDEQRISASQPVVGSILAVGYYPDAVPRSFYFSTTLSPNATNPENRTIRVFGDQLTSTDFLFEVYNRWGNSIFKNQSLTEMSTTGWDGRQNGNLLSSGVYPYSLKYRDTSGKAEHKTGFITIIN